MTRALLVLLVAACGARSRVAERERAPGGLEPIEPGTREPELLSATACARCHAAQHDEWSRSRHAAAWTNGIFRREYREQPRPWCVNCHAPLAPQVAEVAAAGGGRLADEGVGCASCHVRDGRIVARSQRPGSPHRTLALPDFGRAATCANCHQFEFPHFDADGAVRRLTSFPMQATVAQFERGPHARAEEACLSCHATTSGGHLFPGGHDDDMLRRAVTLDVCRHDGQVVMTLENRGAGHHVPTGDVHRHMNLRVWRSTAPEKLYEAFLGRRFTPVEDGGKITSWDSTLAPRERRRYAVDDAALGDGGPLRFELRYVYTADENPTHSRDPGEPTSRVIYERSAAFEELPPCATPP